MATKSVLIRPPRHLASCIAGCILRDTRGVELTADERLNYFPGSPLFTATLCWEGQIHLSDTIAGVDDLQGRPAAPPRLFQKPITGPHTSWNPAAIHAVTIAFFPDAWLRLGGTLQGDPPPVIMSAMACLETSDDPSWSAFWDAMGSAWSTAKRAENASDWVGSDRIKDWAIHLFGQISQSGAGRSLRSTQRRLLLRTGQNRKALEFFAKIEDLHRLSVIEPNATPAELAADAGFADQSHMGRTLKRATGFAPATLNRRIAEDEAFWLYRLLGDRF